MKTQNILIAAALPAFWILHALAFVGSKRTAVDEPTWTGEIVVVMSVLTIPIAVIAYFAGKEAGKK